MRAPAGYPARGVVATLAGVGAVIAAAVVLAAAGLLLAVVVHLTIG